MLTSGWALTRAELSLLEEQLGVALRSGAEVPSDAAVHACPLIVEVDGVRSYGSMQSTGGMRNARCRYPLLAVAPCGPRPGCP
jgi:hypothetical protein